MKIQTSSRLRRRGALLLALSMALGLSAPAASAAEPSLRCDETYYATLDPYGQLLDSSVVKTYATRGSLALTDYGIYDEVINLTDNRSATVAEDGSIFFDLSDSGPDKFYFEGKTAQPYEEFPWKLSLSYTLNGVPTPAEELAGRTGVVEIILTAVPNPLASEYARNNLVLTAASVFNGDDILSLEAPGAQVQLLGNLYAVLYAVLPGEEQVFTIRVGSEDFSYSGMVFLAVPATLQQLEQVAELKEAKEKGEESYHALSDSLDVILNTLDGMSGSINAAASGLDQLNSARSVVSNGKDSVYDSLDRALDATGPLTQSMAPMAGHLASAQEALTQAIGILNEMNGAAQSLTPELEHLRQTITAIQKDTKELRQLATDVEGYNKRAANIADSLEDLLEDLGGDIYGLQLDLYRLRTALNNAKGVSTLSTADILSLLPADQAAQMKQVLELHDQYENAVAHPETSGVPADTSFYDFIILAAFKQGYEAQVEQTVKDTLAQYYTQYVQQMQAAGQTPVSPEEFAAGEQGQAIVTTVKEQAQANFMTAYGQFVATKGPQYQAAAATAQAAVDAYAEFSAKMPAIDTINAKIREVNGVITALTRPTANVVDELADMCDTVGGDGIVDDLSNLAGLAEDLLAQMKKHEGAVPDLLEQLDSLGDMAARISGSADTVLDQIQSLTQLMNQYEPDTQQALTDAQVFTQAASDSISALTEAMTTTRELMRDTDPYLDAGTRQTLSGLSVALRRAGTGLSQTPTLRSAKSTITGLIEEEWNSHAGEDNNLLLMDAAARPQSLTDSRNENVTSIQYIMRSQEIKAEEKDTDTRPETAPQEKTTFWDRVKAMFVDLWHTITNLF